MTDIVERLRTDADRGWFHPGVAAEAADEIERLLAEFELFREAPSKLEVAQYEIERLHTYLDGQVRYYTERRQEDLAEIDRLRVNLGGSVAALKMCNDEIQRMQAEIDQFEEQLAEATTEIEKLRELWENSPVHNLR